MRVAHFTQNHAGYFGSLYYFKVPQGWYTEFYDAFNTDNQEFKTSQLFGHDALVAGNAQELVRDPLPKVNGFQWLGVRTPRSFSQEDIKEDRDIIGDELNQLLRVIGPYSNTLNENPSQSNDFWMLGWLQKIVHTILDITSGEQRPFESFDSSLYWTLPVSSSTLRKNSKGRWEHVLKIDARYLKYALLNPFPRKKPEP